MTKLKRQPEPAPPPDAGLWTLPELAERWKLHPEITRRKARAAGIPFIRLSSTVIRFRIADVLRFEDECADIQTSTEQKERINLMHSELAKKRAARKAK